MEQKQKLTYIGLGLLATVAFLVGVYFLINDPSQALKNSGEKPSYEIVQTVREEDHTKWSDKNEIILTEYSDLQCPACAAGHAYLSGLDEATDAESQLIRENVTLVYRHFPLMTIHDKAFDAAIAAEAAAKQGKLFEFIDIMFENQGEWSAEEQYNEKFAEYAVSLDINKEQFMKDLNEQALADKVSSDMQTGEAANVSATPTFFLNGEKMEYATYDEMKQQLLDAIGAPADSSSEEEPAQETATEEGSIEEEGETMEEDNANANE